MRQITCTRPTGGRKCIYICRGLPVHLGIDDGASHGRAGDRGHLRRGGLNAIGRKYQARALGLKWRSSPARAPTRAARHVRQETPHKYETPQPSSTTSSTSTGRRPGQHPTM
eukprot:4846366-Pyramimonas_sp.AAC.1